MMASYFDNGVFIASFNDDPDVFELALNADVVEYYVDVPVYIDNKYAGTVKSARLIGGKVINMEVGNS